LPKGVQHKISTAIIYIFLLLNLVVTYQGFSILNDVHDQLTPALRIPVSVPYASIPVSFLFMVVYGISDILNQFKR
jgi:TRAP-type C4-dicarboxylate transport system permease small subunit